MKTRIEGSFGDYFPTIYKVAACSAGRRPLSGTISPVFSFISLMKPVGLGTGLLIWALLKLSALTMLPRTFVSLAGVLFRSGNLGLYLRMGIVITAIVVVIITRDNLKERNTDFNKYLLYVNSLPGITSNTHGNSTSLPSFYEQRNWSSENWSNFPKANQQVGSRGTTWIQGISDLWIIHGTWILGIMRKKKFILCERCNLKERVE